MISESICILIFAILLILPIVLNIKILNFLLVCHFYLISSNLLSICHHSIFLRKWIFNHKHFLNLLGIFQLVINRDSL